MSTVFPELVSSYTKDYFDLVVNDSYIYDHPCCPNRWPDVGNGAGTDNDIESDDEIENCPPIEYISTKEFFIASQPEVSEYSVRSYTAAIKRGCVMPPVAGIRCRDGIIVWNGHHRLCSHRLAGADYVPVRIWATFDCSVQQWKDDTCYEEGGD